MNVRPACSQGTTGIFTPQKLGFKTLIHYIIYVAYKKNERQQAAKQGRAANWRLRNDGGTLDTPY